MPDDCGRADDKQAPEVAVTLLGDTAELLFPAGRVLPWYAPNPGRELAPGLERARIGDGCGNRGCADHADARNGLQVTARIARAMLRVNVRFQSADLHLLICICRLAS